MNRRFPEAPRPSFIEEDDLFEDDNWRDKAKCRGTEPGEIDRLFFSDELKGELARLAIGDAKIICGECPVAADCLLFAMKTGEAHGIWGGMTTDDRKKLKEGLNRDRAEAA